jgi:hypothetical protein
MEEITLLGYLSNGVLHAGHRGFILTNSEHYPQNIRGYFVLKKVRGELYEVKKYIPLVS